MIASFPSLSKRLPFDNERVYIYYNIFLIKSRLFINKLKFQIYTCNILKKMIKLVAVMERNIISYERFFKLV